MEVIVFTQNSTFIIGWVSKLLGLIMEGIFSVLDLIGLPNIGLAIILFTVVVNLLMLPLTIKQQKFSKLSAKMQPEIQAIQSKYKNKKDTDSQMAMNQEVQMVYAKYGVSPTGSCMYLLIQMPIIFALYRVIYSIPAYVTKIGNTFGVLAEKIISTDNAEFLKNSDVSSIANTVAQFSKNMSADMTKGVIDVLNRLSSADIATIADHYNLNHLTYNGSLILGKGGLIETYNNFLGLNIGNAPSSIVKEAWAAGSYGLLIGAIMIPLLSALTQFISVKLMPQQPKSGNEQADSMAESMKMMNMFMPLMSAWFCYSFAAGMGLYWIAGNVVRTIQQVIINKHIDKMDFEEIISQNKEKSAKKLEKMKLQQERLNAYAQMNTKNIQTQQPRKTMQNKANVGSSISEKEKDDAMANAASSETKTKSGSGSMFAKAGMVKQYNDKNK
ncbi:MAG: YidC/Oxa1 family membrane protein insertase [Lachnospiraceae bacterium]|jgi:YidC/Oxa1 family membrane protein insertase|nr:YidC/Oxa1 family membrane protein insertase [Lachnospiraceae bacterium]